MKSTIRAGMSALGVFGLAFALLGCTTFMETQDASNQNIVGQASTIPFYTLENAAAAPPVKTILGPAVGNSCKFLPTDKNGSETGALQQMRLKALAMGANGIVGVRYQHSGTSFATNCWQSVTASGTAVIFEKAAGQ